MNMETVGIVLSALVAIAAAFRVYYGQVSEVKEKFATELGLVRKEMNDYSKAISESTQQRVEALGATVHANAGTSQRALDEIRALYLRREDFFFTMNDVKEQLKSISNKLDEARGREK